MIHREQIEWHDIWVTGADDGVMPRALFVGDSIVRSYSIMGFTGGVTMRHPTRMGFAAFLIS